MSEAKGVYISNQQWEILCWRMAINWFDEDSNEFLEDLSEDDRNMVNEYLKVIDIINKKFQKKYKNNKKEDNKLKEQLKKQQEENLKLKQMIDKQHQELQDIKNKLKSILA